MRKTILVFSYLLFAVSSSLFAGGQVFWTENGVAVGSATSGGPAIVSDMKGGAIVAYGDWRNPGEGIYAQRVDHDGNVLWSDGGEPVWLSDWVTHSPGDVVAVSDGRGGAVIAWVEWFADSYYDIYAGRIDSAGAVQWTGVAICTADSAQGYPSMVSDGAGGAIIAWQDGRNGNFINRDIYCQRIDSSGVVKWDSNGIFVATQVNLASPSVTTDKRRGVIIAWADKRRGDYDVFMQRLNSDGVVQWGDSGIAICTADSGQYLYPYALAGDEIRGGIVSWTDKRFDDFDVYIQKVDSSGVVRWFSDGVPVCTLSGNQYEPVIITSDKIGGGIVLWGDERNGNRDIYSQRIDSTGTALWTLNGVPICTADGTQRYSAIVSDGRSGAIITWQDLRNGNGDIYCQRINSSGVVQWGTNELAVATLGGDAEHPVLIEDGNGGAIIAWFEQGRPYKTYAQRVGDAVGIEEEESLKLKVESLKLYPCYPNPFHSFTVICYSLFDPNHTTLKIYNVSGRLVRTLIDENKSPGFYNTTWDCKDDSNKQVSNGVYFYRLETDDFKATKKMIVLR